MKLGIFLEGEKVAIIVKCENYNVDNDKATFFDKNDLVVEVFNWNKVKRIRHISNS